MKNLLPLVILCILCSENLLSQNINYTAIINRFSASNCGNDPGFSTTEEHTWFGFISDNADLAESSTGCVTLNQNGAATLNGTFVTRTRTNTNAAILRTRIDGWEDDMGSRCAFETGFNSDDCRSTQVLNTVLTGTVEYQTTSQIINTGSDYNMRTVVNHQYSSTSLPNAVDNSSVTYFSGGNRPFWGAQGSWALSGGDCAASGTISNNQTSSFGFTTTCRSEVTFRWRVSSQSGSDFLRVFVNGVQQASISGNVPWTVQTISLPFGGSNTIEFRYTKDGSGSSGLDRGFVDLIQLTNANSVNPGTVSGTTTICAGQSTSPFPNIASAQAHSGLLNYQWQRSTNGTTWTNITGQNGTSLPAVSPSQTTFYRRRIVDGCGNVDYSNTVTVTVNTLSTPPTITSSLPNICPNTDLNLIASGGTSGTGATIRWYDSPNGAGTLLGTGSILSVAPLENTTYYARREGTCNNTNDATTIVDVRDFVYGNDGEISNAFCTDNDGWHHFYNGSRILLSVQGDMSGIPSPIVTINDNAGGFYQAPNLPTDCGNNVNPGEESFEMSRSWNFNPNGGTLNGTYNVRFYYQSAERTAVENAANAWIAANTDCGYTYKYANPNGFIWFKNTGSNYTAPDFEGTLLTGAVSSVAGTNYTELSGITSFSGGSGSVVLVPVTGLPVTLSSFDAACSESGFASIQWTSISEVNTSHYTLEKSSDGMDWNQIDKVTAAGNSNTALDYEVLDYEIRGNENTYYRLTQFDFDGSKEVLGTTTLLCNGSEKGFALYPNPATEEVKIQIKGYDSEQSVDLLIIDSKGQLVRKLPEANATGNLISLDISDLAPGYYLVQMMDGETRLETQRLVKQN